MVPQGAALGWVLDPEVLHRQFFYIWFKVPIGAEKYDGCDFACQWRNSHVCAPAGKMKVD